MADLTLTQVRKAYGSVEDPPRHRPRHQVGRVHRLRRSVGLRQVDAAALIAGLEEITSGDARDRRRGGQRRAAVEARHRHGVPVLRALSAYDRLRQHGLRHEARRRDQGRDRPARARRRPTSCSSTKYLDRLPKALSGGQRQRVAIGRAIVRDPKVFLFDEPLSNLDAALRVATRIEIAKLNESMPNTTMIYVTHDQVEAMTLADRIVVLECRHRRAGRLADGALQATRSNLFVAQLHRLAGDEHAAVQRSSGRRQTPRSPISAAARRRCRSTNPAERPEGKRNSFGVRPRIFAIATGDDFCSKAHGLRRAARRSPARLYRYRPAKQPLIAKLPGTLPVKRGATMRLNAAAGHLHIFDDKGQSFARNLPAARAA